MYDEEHDQRLRDQMADINAAPSSTEPVPQTTPADAGLLVAGTQTVQAEPQNVPLDTEAGAAAVGESAPSAATAANVMAGATASATSQARDLNPGGDVGNASAADTDSSADVGSAIGTGDAPAVAASGEGPGSAVPATSASNAAVSIDAGFAAADAGNAAASSAAGQSASDIASSAQPASQGADTVADALRSEIASLEQQLTDAHAEIAKWQGLYNAVTAARAPGAPVPAHRWISLLEVKLSALEHDARDELLDVARQLREAL